jgi:hypothetical protein
LLISVYLNSDGFNVLLNFKYFLGKMILNILYSFLFGFHQINDVLLINFLIFDLLKQMVDFFLAFDYGCL